MKLQLIITLVLLCSLFSLQAHYTVTDIFHHIMTNSNTSSIELGKLVLYFSQKPIIKPHNLKKLKNNQEQLILLCAQAQIDSANVHKRLKEINAINDTRYTINIAPVAKPKQGISCSFTHDNSVLCQYETFRSIGDKHYGLVITFYDKKKLQQLHDFSENLLKVAQSKPVVVIDCGHGGHDTGAQSANGILEKDVTLALGTQIAGFLHSFNIQTHLTRTQDIFLPLDTRTAIAGQCNPCLMISMHANGSSNNRACGIETFFFDPTLLTICLAQEQHPSISLFNQHRKNASHVWAEYIHTQCIKTAATYYPVSNRHVKGALSQILLGTTCPAILIELGFLSNAQEASFLANPGYINHMAQTIADAIKVCLSDQVPMPKALQD